MSAQTPSTSELAARAESLYRRESEKDLEGWAALWAEDAVVSFPHDPARPANETRGKQALVDSMRQKMLDRPEVHLDVRTEPLADGRRVLAHIEARLTFATGVRVRGPLLCILTFDEDGLISAVEEYFVNESFVPDED
jgi:ketosteroid isomerase-like protein